MFSNLRKNIHTQLKWLVANKEMQELQDRRVQLDDYDRWLREFPIVHEVIRDMQAYFQTLPKSEHDYIYLGVNNLRTRLRQRYKK